MTTSTLRLALVFGLGLATLLVAPRSTLADYYDNNFGPENGWVLTVETIPFDFAYINGCVDGQEQVDFFSAAATLTTKTLTTSGNFHLHQIKARNLGSRDRRDNRRDLSFCRPPDLSRQNPQPYALQLHTP